MARQFAVGKVVKLFKPLLTMYLFLVMMVQLQTIFVYGEAKQQVENLISKSSTLENMKAPSLISKGLRPFLLFFILTTTWTEEKSCASSSNTFGVLHL
jgi:hypothetical protein